MEAQLMDIRETLIQVVEAISAALSVDVEVIDNNLIRLAGTGHFQDYIGKNVQKNGVIKRVILPKGQNFIVYNPGHEELCKPCSLYGKCFYKLAVYSPITLKKKSVGVIGISALEPNMAGKIKTNLRSYLYFIEKMGLMISTKLAEKNMLNKIKLMSKQLESIINKVNKGIVATDHNGLVTHINNFALEKLHCKTPSKLLGKSLTDLLPELNIDSIKLGESIDYQELNLIHDSRKFKILCSASPIKIENNVVGLVCSFEDLESVNKLAYTITGKSSAITFEDIVGKSDAIANFIKLAKKVALGCSNVLIIGETGTGKELVARAIHHESPRRNMPFVTINCGAMPESLIESELFGYEKGAFTGANKMGKPGKFAIADGGTIFLDEIETMPLYLQPKLLRVIENREVERIGSNEKKLVDVRIISASNVRLDEMVQRGEFREDLFHRLNVIPLFVPPLRERKNDILVLANYFINKYCKQLNKQIMGLSDETKKIFMDYPWPGNVRELENAIEYGVNLEEDMYISPDNIPFQIKEKSLSGDDKPKTMEEIERYAIIRTLKETGWSNAGKEEAAKILNIGRATLFRKIKKYKITRIEVE